MELSRGQQEYLIELLSGEYLIDEQWREPLKYAIAQHSTCIYDDDELEFLVSSPQSLSAVMRLNTTSSLDIFSKYFALWLNALEYNALDTNSLMEATIVNPDPTSRQKLLQILDIGEDYQIVAVPEIRYMTTPRANDKLSDESMHERRLRPIPIVSAFSYNTFRQLLEAFLTFAQKGEDLLNPFSRANALEYARDLEDALAYTYENQSTWQKLRQRSLELPNINSTYLFPQREQGLMLPGNIEFINYLNAQPPKQTISKTHSTSQNHAFSSIDRLLMQNPLSQFKLNAPKLPSFAFFRPKNSVAPTVAQQHFNGKNFFNLKTPSFKAPSVHLKQQRFKPISFKRP